jgi:spore germination protein KC
VMKRRRLKNIKIFVIICSVTSLIAGCSPVVTEISDIALITATGIDYNKEKKKYVFTTYSVLPTTTSTEKQGKLSEWVVSASGNSIFDTAKNLRKRAGKTLVWMHNKFLIIGEDAARHAFFDIIDFLIRNRQIRITNYLIVSEGKAADKLNLKAENGDFLSNDLLGKVRNEREWGKSISQILQDIANWNSSPYRGFVTGRLSSVKSSNNSEEVLVLNGGSVFNKGKLVGWLNGDEVLVVRLLSEKRKWNDLEFTRIVDFKSSKVTLLYNVSKKVIHSSYDKGDPKLAINLSLISKMGEADHPLNLSNPETILQLEQSASKDVEKMINTCLTHFQKELKVDVIGFSDLFIQYHPKKWRTLRQEWDSVYPTIPIQVHATVKLESLGMSQSTGAD